MLVCKKIFFLCYVVAALAKPVFGMSNQETIPAHLIQAYKNIQAYLDDYKEEKIFTTNPHHYLKTIITYHHQYPFNKTQPPIFPLQADTEQEVAQKKEALALILCHHKKTYGHLASYVGIETFNTILNTNHHADPNTIKMHVMNWIRRSQKHPISSFITGLVWSCYSCCTTTRYPTHSLSHMWESGYYVTLLNTIDTLRAHERRITFLELCNNYTKNPWMEDLL